MGGEKSEKLQTGKKLMRLSIRTGPPCVYAYRRGEARLLLLCAVA